MTKSEPEHFFFFFPPSRSLVQRPATEGRRRRRIHKRSLLTITPSLSSPPRVGVVKPLLRLRQQSDFRGNPYTHIHTHSLSPSISECLDPPHPIFEQSDLIYVCLHTYYTCFAYADELWRSKSPLVYAIFLRTHAHPGQATYFSFLFFSFLSLFLFIFLFFGVSWCRAGIMVWGNDRLYLI